MTTHRLHPTPPHPLDRLLDSLSLDTVDDTTREGRAPDPQPDSRLFGGLLMAHSLIAAADTVDTARVAYSLHTHFLRTGTQNDPIRYQIERPGEGSTFSTRVVHVTQNDRELALVTVSFHLPDDGGVDVAGPPATIGRTAADHADHRSSSFHHDPVGAAFEFREFALPRPVTSAGQTVVDGPTRLFWTRTRSHLPDDPLLHLALLTYVSDFGTVWAVGRAIPHRLAQISTLEHTLWFHRFARVDDWLLFEEHAASAVGWRGLVTGTVHSAAGARCATLSQEVFARPRG